MPDLAARYRRLLWAYPRSWRLMHGAELVTTLLDAAPPERTRPTRAEVLDLLGGGIRLRFRVRGTGAVVAVLLACLCTAVAGAAFGGFLGWQTTPALPNDAEATRVAQHALAPGQNPHPQRWNFVYGDSPLYTDPAWLVWLLGTDEYEAGQVFFDIRYPDGAESAVHAEAAHARTRLRANGWRLSDTAAHRDGHRIEVTPTHGRGESAPLLRVSVMRDRPAAVLPLTTAGLITGALAGWLLVAAAWRRGLRQAPWWRAATILLYSLGVLATLPATAMSATAVTMSYLHPDDLMPAWAGYTFIGLRPLAWIGLSVLLTAWLTTLPTFRKRLTPAKL